MTNPITTSELQAFADGESNPNRANEIRSELLVNPDLARQLALIEEVNDALRGTQVDVKAPRSLRDTINSQFAISDPSSNTLNTSLSLTEHRAVVPSTHARRRNFLIAGAAAAGVVGVAAILPGLRRQSPGADVASAFFRDFENYLLKDRADDIIATDTIELAQWYSTRLPFSLPPVSSNGAGVSLVGGRLCWILERRLASLSYQSTSGPVVLYITQANGIRMPPGEDKTMLGEQMSWHRAGSNASVIWRSNSLLMAMVGTQEVRKLISLAKAIVG